METEASLLERIADELRRQGRRQEHPRFALARQIAEHLVTVSVTKYPDAPVRDTLARSLDDNTYNVLHWGEPAYTNEILDQFDYTDADEAGRLDSLVEQIALWIFRADRGENAMFMDALINLAKSLGLQR